CLRFLFSLVPAPIVKKIDHFNLSERAAYAFYLIQLQQLEWSVARRVSHFTPSCEAQNASSSGVPMPSPSEQAAYAFYL
ncbi:hypothetical protein, partial [Bacillus cereus group sp. BfR-BA-01382]|uniref:hypothetical protein n=1 Tax=Bacillus cereus group sp. BfR-BA-01382 TaxID=2920326 RepID=UPI00320B603F